MLGVAAVLEDVVDMVVFMGVSGMRGVVAVGESCSGVGVGVVSWGCGCGCVVVCVCGCRCRD